MRVPHTDPTRYSIRGSAGNSEVVNLFFPSRHARQPAKHGRGRVGNFKHASTGGLSLAYGYRDVLPE